VDADTAAKTPNAAAFTEPSSTHARDVVRACCMHAPYARYRTYLYAYCEHIHPGIPDRTGWFHEISRAFQPGSMLGANRGGYNGVI